MSDNTLINSGSGGDTIRSIDRSSDTTPIAAKTQVVQLDMGGEANEQLMIAVAKGVQAALNMPVLQPKDAGRTYVSFYLDQIAGVTTEVLATMIINVNSVVTSATTWTVPTGKTLRIQAINFSAKNTSTTIVNERIRIRVGSPASALSSVISAFDIPGFSAVSGVGQAETVSFPDGIEIPAGQSIGISQLCSATTCTISACVTGYYY